MRLIQIGLCVWWGSYLAVMVALGVGAFADVPPEPIAPPFPDAEEYVRVWHPRHLAALDELIHADTLAGKYQLPEGYVVKDGAVYFDGIRLPKVWAVVNAGVIVVPPDRRQFNRKSYMVPLDIYERYEERLGD